MEKTVSARQLGLLAFISTFGLKLTVLPSLLFEAVKVDMVLVVVFWQLVGFGFLLMILWLLKKNQDISFYAFLCKHFGVFIAKIIMLVLSVFFLFKLLLIIEGGYGYARQAIFQEASLFLFMFILLVSISSLYLFKSKSFARTVEFFYPIIAVMFTIFIIVALLTAELQDIRPLFQSGNMIADTIFSHSIVTNDYVFMLFLMGRIKFDRKSNKTILSHVIFAQLLLIIFYFVYTSIFKYTAIIHPNAISEIIQFLPIPSIIGNFDWFAVTLMMILFVLQGGIFIFCTCEPLFNAVKLKKFKINNLRKWVLIFVNALAIVLIYVVFKNFENLKVFVIDYGKYLSAVVAFLPIFFFVWVAIKQFLDNKSKVVGNNEKILEVGSGQD